MKPLVVFLLVAFTLPSFGEHAVPVAPPKTVTVGNQVFELSVSGLSNYMDRLKESNSKVYHQIHPYFDNLKSKNFIGNILVYGGAVSGLALISIGAGTSQMGLMYTGVGLAVLGPVVGGFIVAPSQSELLDFVNHHNQVNPTAPLKVSWRFGVLPYYDGGIASLGISF